MKEWRLLDTGIRNAASNMALDQVLLESKSKGLCPNTFRFLMFYPTAALLGYHQRLSQEIREDYCREQGIDINRRITGGGALLFDPTQIGWEIICDKSFFALDISHPGFYEMLSRPIVKTLNQLNIPAEFRPRNDIEVRGRKISGTGGTDQGDAFLFQGTLLVDFDVNTMFRALRVPIEKLKFKELESAKERVTCILWEKGTLPGTELIKQIMVDCFREEFGVTMIPQGLTPYEESRLKELEKTYESSLWVDKIKLPVYENSILYSLHKTKGGIIRLTLKVDSIRRKIQYVLITGDFFSFPQRCILDLESEFKNTPATIKSVEEILDIFFRVKHPGYHIQNIDTGDLRELFRKALDKLILPVYHISLDEANHLFTLHGSFEEIIRRSPRHLLVPYCAKSTACGYRNLDDCQVCDGCKVSDAYTAAKTTGMSVTTILSFEHLMETLRKIKDEGATSFIGSCCEAFYAKHMEEMMEPGLPGILIDIDSTTCYDLGKATDAYKGAFENETVLNMPLLKKVLDAL